MKLLHKDKKAIQNLISEVIGLEKVGDYEKAYELLREFWADITELPEVSKLSPSLAAEILLRCGSIIGFLGNLKQIPNAQEYSKNILTHARAKFIELYKPEKIAECENYLASAYSRTGEIKEARVWIEESLSHKLNDHDSIRLYSHIIKAVILLADSKDDEVILYLKSVHSYFDKADYFLRGCYCTNLSLAYKNVGKFDESLRHLNFARVCHQKSKHLLYLATVENNLAQLFKLRKEFSNALESADNAIQLFTEMNDALRIALGIDTKAQIFIGKEDFNAAVDLTNKAIEILKRGENFATLSEVYLTKATAQISAGNIAEASLTIYEAIRFAKVTGEDQAKRIAEFFESAWFSKYPPRIEELYSEQEKRASEKEKRYSPQNEIELDLPPEISPKQLFFGVWIHNDSFESLGLKKGYLAIAVKTNIKKGDLVAVCDKKNDLVIIGFFEHEFGLVCLENPVSEPDLYNEEQIRIMGKVIGYCEPKINAQGRYTVNPIFLKDRSRDEETN